MKIHATFQDDLTKKLLGLSSAASHKVQTAALMEGAEPIRAEAERRAPRRRPPHLALHIIADPYSEAELDRGAEFVSETAAVAVGPDRDHFYGYFSEKGTVREPARPWFRPAVDTKSSTSLRIICARLWDAIRAFASSGTSVGKDVGTIGSRNL